MKTIVIIDDSQLVLKLTRTALEHAGYRVQTMADPGEFEPEPTSVRRVARESALSRMVRGRRAVLGIDRLDYTKGLIERVRAFELFLRAHPHWHDRVSLVQIAAPTMMRFITPSCVAQ